ncbi:DUF1194 domain-containing protein [Nereida sp. MMG025]|uniref:DUF1194 domain-containing protein n=1 Tax=Nereida sp. MMG025 TaxID=2909981 RepID=UPI001F477608|nr:DUF1194 domain-containing protein [Nereida sp. MMG025]
MLATPAWSGCRLALVLAVDVSSSVDAREDALQRGGLARALVAPDVVRAFLAGGDPVAIAIYEWSGRYHQTLIRDWTLITSQQDLQRVSTTVATSTRAYAEFPTAMGEALLFGRTLLDDAPACAAQTLDMSGDGSNNEGFGPREVYATGVYDGVTVNGLVVNAAEFEAETQLIAYYAQDVLHGPSAFFEVAQGFEDFERAMRRKLEREVSGLVVGVLDVD